MKFIAKEYLQRFDSLSVAWKNPHVQKPVSALALAEKELSEQTANADAVTEFSMRRLSEPFDADGLCEQEVLGIEEADGTLKINLANGVLTLANPEWIEREVPAKKPERTVLKALELHTIADKFQLHLLLRDCFDCNDCGMCEVAAEKLLNGTTENGAVTENGENAESGAEFSGYRYCTANCDFLRFEEKAA